MKHQVNYIVLPENNLVVCELQDRYGKQYRDTARCSGGDKFDEKIGKRIAYLRADNKRKRATVRFLNEQVISEIKFQISYLKQQMKKYEKCVDNTHISIDQNLQEISKLS